jgi:hypothetical protein
MRFRSVVIAVVTALGVIAPATGAAAAGSCSIVAPTKVVLDQPYEEVPLRLAGDCATSDMRSAVWSAVHPTEGPSDFFFFDSGDSADIWGFYEWEAGTARYTVRPEGASDTDYNDLIQNTPYITVKLGSRLSGTVTRSNGRMTFNAYARTYSPNLSDWYKRAYAKVSLMYRAPGSSTWTWVKAGTTNSAGKATLSVVPRSGAYRLMIKETPTVWASYSSAVRGK